MERKEQEAALEAVLFAVGESVEESGFRKSLGKARKRRGRFWKG